MGSLFGHLATRFPSGAENLATEALAYVLARSAAARSAFNRFAGSLISPLPVIRSFRTQFSAKDAGVPDLAGFDADGRLVILIENKFWAGLTPNQPVAYLERLPEHGPGLLLFVVPQRRLHTIWPDLVTSAARAGVQLPAVSLHSNDTLRGQVGERTLAVTSWYAILNCVESEAKAVGENLVLSDIAQLRGLCEHMDSTGYVPATVQELTNLEVPRRLIALADLAQEMCDRAISAGIANNRNVEGRDLRPAHSWYGAGRYIRIGAAGGWAGIDHRCWARHGVGPLWITFGASEYGRGAAVLKALAAWTVSNPVRAFEADGAAAVPLRISPHATRDVVLDDLHLQLTELHELLRVLQATPAAAFPDPVEAA